MPIGTPYFEEVPQLKVLFAVYIFLWCGRVVDVVVALLPFSFARSNSLDALDLQGGDFDLLSVLLQFFPSTQILRHGAKCSPYPFAYSSSSLLFLDVRIAIYTKRPLACFLGGFSFQVLQVYSIIFRNSWLKKDRYSDSRKSSERSDTQRARRTVEGNLSDFFLPRRD